jgi:hypothetical protein
MSSGEGTIESNTAHGTFLCSRLTSLAASHLQLLLLAGPAHDKAQDRQALQCAVCSKSLKEDD